MLPVSALQGTGSRNKGAFAALAPLRGHQILPVAQFYYWGLQGSKRKQKAPQSSFTHHVVGVKGREIGSREHIDVSAALLTPGPLRGSKMQTCGSTGNATCHAVAEAAGNTAEAEFICTT